MEARLFDPANPPDYFTADWYSRRDHAPHLEQGQHKVRLMDTAELVSALVMAHLPEISGVSDMGCGDGGLLSLLRGLPVPCWGYDLQANNVLHAVSVRGVDATYGDFLTDDDLRWGDLVVMTECLEHLQDPHAWVRKVAEHARFLVASSPAFETPESHDAFHAYCWDMDGYRALLEQGGFRVIHHEISDPLGYGFQIIAGRK